MFLKTVPPAPTFLDGGVEIRELVISELMVSSEVKSGTSRAWSVQ